MTHSHEHKGCCKHADVKFCKACDRPYCADCGKEWYASATTYTTNPWYVYPNRVYPDTYTITSGGIGSSSAVQAMTQDDSVHLTATNAVVPCTHTVHS